MFLHLQEWTKAEASALPVNVLRKVQCAWFSVTESEFILSVVWGGGGELLPASPWYGMRVYGHVAVAQGLKEPTLALELCRLSLSLLDSVCLTGVEGSRTQLLWLQRGVGSETCRGLQPIQAQAK